MKKFTLVILGIIFFNILAAQTPLTPIQKADSSFKHKDYLTSIQLYEKALKKSNDTAKKNIYYQIAECYRYGNNYADAKTNYDKAVTAGYAFPIIDLRIGEMLLPTGDYASAKTYIEKYLTQVPNDNVAKIRLEACNLGLKGLSQRPLLEVANVQELNTSFSEYGIAYFKNNKIIFASTRKDITDKTDKSTLQGYSDMYESTFDNQKDQWSKPTKLQGTINTPFNEGTFTFDSSKNYGYYTQCNGDNGKKHQCNIMYAHYNEASNTWENAKLFSFNSQTYRIQQPALTSDGKAMYFSSDMPGGYGGADLYVIRKISDTVWGKPENLGPEINTIGNEGFPYVSGDTLLVFASDGLPGFGGLDIFTSSIKNGKYSKPVNMMPPINSSADDFNLIFKKNKNEGLFTSNRVGGAGTDDIYSYDLIPVILTVKGNVKDKSSNKNIDKAVLIFKGSDGSIDSVITGPDGNFAFTKLKANTNYLIRATRQRYMNDSKTLKIGNELYSKTFDKSMGLDLDFALIKMTRDEIKLDNIYYDYDKWTLREESKKELDKLINILKETPDVNVQISSHTDERGEKNYNIDLSQKRAQSVVDYLIAGGISSTRLTAKGYGFAMPIKKNAKTEEEHQMNRRTTFKILNTDND